MSRESIEYFINNSFIDTGNLKIFFTTGNPAQNIPGKINDTSGIFSKESSFFFDFEKSGKGDCVLFSNYQSGGDYPSGFAFGVTDSNTLFFESYDIDGPVVYSSDHILSKRNLVNAQLSNNLVTFNFFNSNLGVNSESFPINTNYITQSDEWHLGSGKHNPVFTGNLYNFLYFNDNLSFESIKDIFSGFAYNVTTGGSGEYVLFSGFSGYENIYTGYSGFTGYKIQKSEEEIVTPFFFFDPLSGVIENITGSQKIPIWTGECFKDIEQGIIYKWIDITGFYSGITGYQLNSGFETGYNTITEEIPLSGFISGLSGSIPVYNTGYVFSGSGSEISYNLNTGYLEKLNYNSILYLGEQYENSISELYYTKTGIFREEYSKSPVFNFAYNEFDLVENSESGKQSFFLNGQFLVESGFDNIGNIFNPKIELQEDYWLEDNKIINTNGFVDLSDFGIFDLSELEIKKHYITGNEFKNPIENLSFSIISIGSTGVKFEFQNSVVNQKYYIRGTNNFSDYFFVDQEIKSTGKNFITKSYFKDYAFFDVGSTGFKTGYLPRIKINSGDYIFLNGQKLIEGLNYINFTGDYRDDGLAIIDDEIFSITFKEKKENKTGEFNYSGLSFIKDSIEYYLNGIRQKKEMYIQHSLENDGLAHQDAFLSKTGVIYNNEQNFFE